MPGPPMPPHEPDGASRRSDPFRRPSLWRHGPAYDLLARIGLVRGDARDVWRLSATLGAIGWAPILLFSLIEFFATGGWHPLATNIVHHSRWLVALPAVFVSQQLLDGEIARALESLRAGSLLTKGDAALAELEHQMKSSARRRALELALAVAALVPVFVGFPADLAHGWNHALGLPVFRFFLLLWLAHWIAWTVMVARLVRLGLDPIASHPDRRGGLGRLGTPIRGLGFGLFGLGSIVAASLGQQLLHGALPSNPSAWLVAWVALAVGLAALPGLPLIRPLRIARRQALDDWGATACQHNRAFEERWLHRDAADALGAPEISSMADLGTAHEVVHTTGFAPLTREQLMMVLGAALAPLVPVALALVPLVDVLKFLIGMRP